MHPTQRPTDSQQQPSMDYPLTPPHAIAPHPGYLPHGVPYPPMPPGPMAPYLPTAQGYGQQYQVWPTYAPYFTHPTTPVPNAAPMPVPPHAASGMGGPMSVPPPATPVGGPHRIPKHYVNSQRGPGVWEFDVSVISSEAKSVFQAHSAMGWEEFRKEVLKRLRDTVLPVQLAFRVSGVSGKLSYLNDEADWESALNSINTKITTARKNAVSLEVRNIAKPSSKASKASSARGKRRREDDAPPPMSEEQGAWHTAFKELDNALKCEAHGGHCFVDRTGGRDNHQRLDHKIMSLWAKKMSLNEATIYTPPNMKGFDRSSTKKPRHSRGTPEVHVAVNIASPVPATGASVTSVVSDTHQDNCRPTSVSNVAHPTPPATNHLNPPVRMLLELMDLHDPALDFKYVDLESELVEFGMKGVMDVYKMPQVLLASFGCLGKEGTRSLHAYVRKWLLPLIQPEGEGRVVGGKREDAAVKVTEVGHVTGDRKGKGRLLKEESRDVIIVWSSDEDKDEEGEQGTQGMDDKNGSPPIEVLKNEDDEDEDNAATDTSESFIDEL
ncbi:hypothetical protein BJY52DRAFT_1226005 [Lactarius psammicola]|nr:hypothetical protein BJY52DRAFT_1226005 [Lactarius psammicola]